MYRINRSIEIDAGHRIKLHSSKCRNLHGHRYKIQMNLYADSLIAKGSQSNMVMDFGFSKEIMIECIYEKCDHSFIVDAMDNYLINMFEISDIAKTVIDKCTAQLINNPAGMKLYVVPFSPTAEALAKHWHNILSIKLLQLHDYEHTKLKVESIRVYETPNCWAEYPYEMSKN